MSAFFSLNDRIVFQGDSITDCNRNYERNDENNYISWGSGYMNMIGHALRARYAAQDLNLYNRGISGNQITHLQERWQKDCLDLKPALLNMLIGVNDTWRGFDGGERVPVDRYEEIYRALIEATLEVNPEVRIVLCEPFVLTTGVVTEAWLPEIKERQQVVRKLVDAFDTLFVPFQLAFTQACKNAPMEYWLYDGVHPTPAGHYLMSETWLRTTGI